MNSSQRERTHSSRIRLIESVYKECVKCVKEDSKEDKKKKTEKKEKQRDKVIKRDKKKINSYQLFVQEENKKKDKYKDLTGPERLATIAQAWEKRKRKEKKEKKGKKELKKNREKKNVESSS